MNSIVNKFLDFMYPDDIDENCYITGKIKNAFVKEEKKLQELYQNDDIEIVVKEGTTKAYTEIHMPITVYLSEPENFQINIENVFEKDGITRLFSVDGLDKKYKYSVHMQYKEKVGWYQDLYYYNNDERALKRDTELLQKTLDKICEDISEYIETKLA